MNNRPSAALPAALAAALLILSPAGLTAQSPPVFPVSMPSRAPGRDVQMPPPGAGDAAAALPQETGGEGRKSVGLAAVYSLLLPGMGELYAGDYGAGKYFTAADGALWLGLFAVDLHARSMQDDARAYAALHAGFDPSGKDDEYFVDVGNFHDVYDYNEQVLRDRDAYKLYDPAAEFWRWDDQANMEFYRDRRVAADGMFNNTRFVAAALLANRVLSAINAARIAISANRESDAALGFGASILGGAARPHGIALSITRRF